jgi:hypothetical protein
MSPSSFGRAGELKRVASATEPAWSTSRSTQA